MSRYIYQNPAECARALRLIMEQMPENSESHNALLTAVNYLGILQMDCDKEKREREESNAKHSAKCARKKYAKEPMAVGDEIKVYDDSVEKGYFRATIMDIDCDGALWILDDGGVNTVINPDDERKKEKTGYHFDYIKDLIYSMEEGAKDE